VKEGHAIKEKLKKQSALNKNETTSKQNLCNIDKVVFREKFKVVNISHV
jgi:hypothetical protein